MRSNIDDLNRSLAQRFDQLARRGPATPSSGSPEPTNTPNGNGHSAAGSPTPPGDDFSRRLATAMRGSGEPTPPTPSTADRQAVAVPTGNGERSVLQGDCLISLSGESGHLWQTIWDDPANAELRAAREPNVLLPEDRVHIPPIRQKWEPGQTEARHRFHRHDDPAVLSLRLVVRDEPLANHRYAIHVDGRAAIDGFTDPEGKLRCPIPAGARRGRLVIGDGAHEFELQLGHMDPVESIPGVQKRLLNLGYDCPNTDGTWDRGCEAALRHFQRRSGLDETGRPDEPTRRTLREQHGS